MFYYAYISTSQYDVPVSTLSPASSTASSSLSASSTRTSSDTFSSSSTTTASTTTTTTTSATTVSSSSTSSPTTSLSPPSSSLSPSLPLSTSSSSTTTTTGAEHHAPLPHNQSPITIYSAPPKLYKPDHLATIDLIIVVIYICLLLSTSISTMIRTRKSIKRKAALSGSKQPAGNNFLAAGRKMSWFTVGASIFASNLGSEHFIGLSGSAAANGISVAAFEINALVILQLATWIFLPVLIVSKISTLPEYMSKRFGGKRIRTYLAILSILLYIFTKISVNLYSGGIFIQQAVGWNLYSSAMFILALTCIMTLTGGLKGAMVIDNLQAIVMTIGASIVSTRALVAIGGWEGLKQRYSTAVPSKVPANLTHCAQPNPRAFQMLRPYNDHDMPWIGFLIGQTPASIWYWAADQMMVQRFLSARSLAHVQGSSVFAGYLKILPLVFMVIPGMISRCLFTDEVGCIDPVECQRYCQSSVSCSNTAYPRLVLELMPMGARGMMVAAMVAALMGDLCNVFNSASALFSCDIWPLFRKHATQKEQETVGRVFVICLVLASIMWIPVIQEMQGGQLFIYIQAVAAMFAPPICAVYICAVLWKRTNETGAFWSMMIGFALGLLRMTMSFMYKEPSCGQHIDERPWILKHVHYMYYAAFLFWTTIASTVLISRLTKPPAPFRLIRTTFWTRFDTNIRKDDKNVFEMKYSGATINSSSANNNNNNNIGGRPGPEAIRAANSPRPSEDLSTAPSETYLSSRSSQQRLFTIEEQQEKKAADLSSVIVDINKAAAASKSLAKRPDVPQTAPISLAEAGLPPHPQRRAGLQHQASLTASASAAVGEAGKFLVSKLATTEVGFKGAKDIVMAAASQMIGGGGGGSGGGSGAHPSSRIKFKNLESGDDDEDEDDDDEEEFEDEDGSTTNAAESTMDDEDEDSDFVKRQRQKRNRRSQSVLSAALSSYKQKQRGGYQKALNEDDDDDDEDDDEMDEKVNLNRSASFKSKPSSAVEKGPDLSSSTDDRQTPTMHSGGSDRCLLKGSKSSTGASAGKRSARSATRRSQRLASKRSTTGARAFAKYEEKVDDETSTRTYRCLDNSVSLLIKTNFEETLLRIAVVAIMLVATGIFIIFSLPPTPPPRDVVDILIKN